MQTRRQFIANSAAAAGLFAGMGPNMARAASDFEILEARAGMVQLAPPGYPATEVWSIGGTLPGPVLRVAQGARVQKRLINSLPQATAMHWHGVRLDNAMDGVPGLTQDAIAPGDSFDYDFIAPDAGTFWYHSHNQSVEQVARGLRGALIVEEPDPIDVDRDEVLVLDDWLIDPETGQLDTDFASAHSRSHAGRMGNLFTTNGVFDLGLPVQRHQRLRLRLINAANARIFELGLIGLEGWTVALDGMPLSSPEPVAGTMVLGPGQRVDLIVDVVAADGDTAFVVRAGTSGAQSQVAFPVSGQASLARRAAPPALPPNPDQAVDLSGDVAMLDLNMQGGAMGGLRQAVLDGESLNFNQLAQANQFWSFNGTVGMTGTPLARLDRGQAARLSILNDTSFPHAIHLHGMHFREVLADGDLGPLRDTLLMTRGERRDIAFTARNPGDWLLHCHMLSHAEAGMMTWVQIA